MGGKGACVCVCVRVRMRVRACTWQRTLARRRVMMHKSFSTHTGIMETQTQQSHLAALLKPALCLHAQQRGDGLVVDGGAPHVSSLRRLQCVHFDVFDLSTSYWMSSTAFMTPREQAATTNVACRMCGRQSQHGGQMGAAAITEALRHSNQMTPCTQSSGGSRQEPRTTPLFWKKTPLEQRRKKRARWPINCRPQRCERAFLIGLANRSSSPSSFL